MKRILALVLALVLLFTLAACGKEETPSTDSGLPSSGAAGVEEFVKPENYATVLLVTINPQFKLYLDAKGTVLAVEAVNKDAQSFKDSIIFENQNVEAVVQKIVTTANEKGFVKEDATVSLEISEKKSGDVNVTDILNKATDTANQTATELKLQITVKAEDKTEDDSPQEIVSSDNTSSDTASAESNDSSTNTESKPQHKHSYSEATCTQPKKCSCGEIGGPALGHKYKEGVCSRCKAKDPNFSYTAVTKKNGKWSLMYVIDSTLYDASLTLCGSADNLGVSIGYGDLFSTLPEDFQQEIREDYADSYIVFEGEEYYIGRGDGDGFASVTESETTVTVTDLSGNKLVLTRTGENTMKVKTSPDDFSSLEKVPVGALLTFTAE